MSKKQRIYAGDDLPDDLRVAAVDLMDEVTKIFEAKYPGGQISTAEVIGMCTIVLNEVNREVTYGLWKDGDLK